MSRGPGGSLLHNSQPQPLLRSLTSSSRAPRAASKRCSTKRENPTLRCAFAILTPHLLFAGTMHNKSSNQRHEALQAHGLIFPGSALNCIRGTGLSEGVHDKVPTVTSLRPPPASPRWLDV